MQLQAKIHAYGPKDTEQPPLQNGTPVIQGTQGNYERLDSSFQVRHDSFFSKGRVFAVLFTEGLGETTPVNPYNVDVNITEVRFGGRVYTTIRRFVVVLPQRGSCYACPISTYGNRACEKQGVDQQAHGVIYTSQNPAPLRPRETNIVKGAIKLIPSDPRIWLSPDSRINYALCHPIQYNVKVKDLGMIHPDHVRYAVNYWNMEMQRGQQ
ncbi:hypothetical protein W97_04846 [Coniosporium apollinis CBS 100218]|uniref:DUF6590 domain-containing protein n=1 Tax=Coniosporium apollinis (strain CBS 100218) TaxID=1168221 RepID=R7YUV4_CONA1|nr:uncharacterized protein W97_04846 [Coniosporium apollinis CBS 100218]EON65608.1 hypothetical protein W97_04846 [Coniosporium apollinis CBS 100218]